MRIQGLAVASMLLVVLATGAGRAVAGDEGKRTPVEHAERVAPKPGILGTRGYGPTELEKPFLEKLDKGERTTGGMFQDYSLGGKDGKYVSWFGIVRNIREGVEGKRTYLVVEMKYFDGLTDTHQQIVSINGAGDFRVTLDGTRLGIRLLSLVRVYGVVEEKDSARTVTAEYVRHFDWGTFAFMPYGKDRGNPEWRKHLTVPEDRAYGARPSTSYYEARLGRRPLYERLGGDAGVAKLAVEFFLEAREDKGINANAKIKAGWVKLENEYLHARFRAYLARIAGGPDEKAPGSIEDALRGLALTPEQWKTVLAVMRSSMDAVGIASAVRDELLGLMEKRADQIVVKKGGAK
jgi:truncated hemoglobin YjbI